MYSFELSTRRLVNIDQNEEHISFQSKLTVKYTDQFSMIFFFNIRIYVCALS